ncbi:MAG: phosphate regulon sensor histidine kinase PhoR [Gammaproteobacteria bacterium]|nr:phosphate regulon sensor histidine kinase PhoR [Gammaproteobacteria bacterium]MCH9743498.1 phosphate regulon sensor histidine kinase PhoR [Gammaproteobacteria bacterium]
MSVKYKYKKTERLLAEAMPEGIVILDVESKLNWCNRVASRQLGLELSQHKHQAFLDIVPHPDLKKLFIEPESEEPTGSVTATRIAQYVQQQQATPILIESPTNPAQRLRLQRCPYWGHQQLIIVHDVTDSYRLEAMRQDFVANISHELRTPLTVFHGYIELLKDYPSLEADHFSEIIRQMTGQCLRMENLVGDLLLLSSLESDHPNVSSYEEVAIAPMLEKICEDANSLSGDQKHKISLSADENIILPGNIDELRSAFSNIVFNAVRYTPAGSNIEVRCFQDEQGRHIEVEDNGIGIAAEHLPKITQRFYRVDRSRTYKGKGGTGLGLAIVKHVLLRHNAKLIIKSEVDKGSTFRCSFA